MATTKKKKEEASEPVLKTARTARLGNPTGVLLLIGGHEDRGANEVKPDISTAAKGYQDLEILRTFVREAKGPHPRIEVVVTASESPDEMGEMYQGIFDELKQQNVGILNPRTRPEANDPELIKRVEAADAILFSGGDQFRLGTLLGGTQFHACLLSRYRTKGLVVAGTSAGAMAQPHTMLYEGLKEEAMLRGDVKISSGLGMIDDCIVDTHFIKRGRFSRLAQAIITSPACLGIGLGEDTALLIREGRHAECLGSGMVIIIDGANIGYTNITEVADGDGLCVENLRVHALVRGNKFDMIERRFIPK